MTTPRLPNLLLSFEELIVDNFAGGGGASTGICEATGRAPDLAINHDREALALYEANHPETRVMCEDVFDVCPRSATSGKPVGLAWFSPDCTFFSKARGAKPHRDRNRARRRRGLAGVVIKWAAQVRPRVICVENVEEFKEWGPLGDDGLPDPSRKGESFRRWRSRLINLGYTVEARELRACDYGAPTSRKRLFIIARCDGQPIVWPDPTHGPGRAAPHRTAAECIDWAIPCPSIFDRARPLADATLRRIARGLKRYVLESKEPFIVTLTHSGADRVYPIREPLRTVTCANRGEQALVVPYLSTYHGERRPSDARGAATDAPLPTQDTANRYALIAPTLVQTGYGERPGQAPRAPGLHKPLGTIMATGEKHALVAAFLAKHFGGGENGQQTPGLSPRQPLGTITAVDHHAVVACHLQRDFGASVGAPLTDPHPTITAGGGGHAALVSSHLVKFKGTSMDGQPVTEPLATVQAQGNHYAEVRAFLLKYNGTDQNPQLGLPLDTVTTKDRFAVITVAGTEYAIVDIGMRMLTPRELFNAQGVPRSYVIDPVVKGGKRLTKTAQVRMCGNMVPPDFSRAIVGAQFSDGPR